MLRRIVSGDIGGDLAIAVVTGLDAEQVAARGALPDGIPVYPKPLSVERLRDLLDKVSPVPAHVAVMSERKA